MLLCSAMAWGLSEIHLGRVRLRAEDRQPNGHGPGAPSSADGPARRAGRRARDGEVRKAVPAPEPRSTLANLVDPNKFQPFARLVFSKKSSSEASLVVFELTLRFTVSRLSLTGSFFAPKHLGPVACERPTIEVSTYPMPLTVLGVPNDE